MLNRVGLGAVNRWTRVATTSSLLALVGSAWSCAGPEGVFMNTTPSAETSLNVMESEPAPEVVWTPSDIAPTANRNWASDPFVSPQGVSLRVPPARYFESSVEGRDLHYWVVGEGGETILLLGGKHGNERSSSELAYRFLEWVLQNPDQLEGRRLVIAPLVNPDGFARNTRENAHLVDLNRNFPAKNWRAADSLRGWQHRPGPHPRSEPETRFLLYLLNRFPADRVISLHGAASCVNWDGPAEDLAREMATDCGLPPRASLGYPTPGSFGSYLGLDLEIPTITLELTENKNIGKPFETYRRALLTGILHPTTAPHRLSG